ncbi:MAG TPA: signal recognition particle receptor subunit alpha, partial [Ktedonobacterales bacterium]
MFKRLRKNLFGQPEGEQEELEHETEAPPLPTEAPPAPAPPATTTKAPTESAAPAATRPVSRPVSRPAAPAPPPPPVTPPALAAPASTTPPSAPVTPPPATAAPAEEEETALEEIEEPEEEPEQRRGRFRNPFRLSLGRTRQLFGQMTTALEEADEISDELWDELEETLITGDVGVETTERLMGTLRERVAAERLERGSELREALKEELELLLGAPEPLVFSDTSKISVYLVVGVNGVGKTTSIAKMANQLKRQKHRVMLAAGDTFRAAATEQLKTWGERVGVPVISHQHGADPGAVVYDAMQAAQARNTDVLIVDTAGRLHTKYNLMEELKKM